MIIYTFTCPKCQCTTFEEILVNVTQSTSFTRMRADDVVEPDYGNASTEGGEFDRYQCAECGHLLLNPDGTKVANAQQLQAWMEQHGQARAAN